MRSSSIRTPSRTRPPAKRVKPTVVVTKPKYKKPKIADKVYFGLGFPNMAVVKHRYAQNFDIVSTSGAITFLQFCCNGMWDPYITGAGHQPLYFDQLTTIYDHYCVTSAKIKVQVVPLFATEYGFTAGILLNDADATTGLTTGNTCIEQNRCQVWRMGSGTNGTQVAPMYADWNCYKEFGPDPLDDPSLSGSSSANPTETTNFLIWYEGISATTNAQVQVEIEYTATWHELKKVAAS